jgi:hypothetical protein
VTFEFTPATAESELPYEPHLRFSDKAWRKLTLYTQRCSFEIGGLGYVRQEGSDFVVDDVFIVRQDVNDIATRLDTGAVHELLVETIESGRDASGLKLWWHSHAEEATFWSGEDEATIDRFRNEGMLSLVTNHRLRFLARLDRYEPRATTWIWLDRPELDSNPTPQEELAVDEEIAAKTRHIPRNSPRIF